MPEIQFVTQLHTSSKRDYFARMTPEKPECMRVAKLYDERYWDGDRKYGYGGYHNDGRWKPVAEAMVKHYGLSVENNSSVFDIGYGKGFLLDEFRHILADHSVVGTDISEYAARSRTNGGYSLYDISCCTKIRYYPPFSLVYSINVFHNLGYKDLKKAIQEMVRITGPEGNSYICVESYRNEEELTNLQCWALTCASFYTPDDWLQIYEDNGYKGDYEWIYFS